MNLLSTNPLFLLINTNDKIQAKPSERIISNIKSERMEVLENKKSNILRGPFT